jgi:hypothetical protein
VLERRSPPTFDVLVELQERDRLAVHPDVAQAVDTLVRGYPLQPEIRWRDAENEVHVEKPPASTASRGLTQGTRRAYPANGDSKIMDSGAASSNRKYPPVYADEARSAGYQDETTERKPVKKVRIYPYGVARNRLQQAAHRLGVPAFVAKDINEADIVMTLRAYYRSRQQPITEAEARGVPIFVLRANTINQMEQSLAEIFNLPEDPSNLNYDEVTNQTESAIQAVLSGQRWVDLPPAASAIRRIQHEMARQAQLVSHSYGKDPNRRVRIFRE